MFHSNEKVIGLEQYSGNLQKTWFGSRDFTDLADVPETDILIYSIRAGEMDHEPFVTTIVKKNLTKIIGYSVKLQVYY